MLLSKKTYRAVVRGLDHFRKQHEEDRRESPNAIPPEWGSPIEGMIRRIARENGEHLPKDTPRLVLDYLCKQGLLVHYAGGVTFPTDEPLPTEGEIRAWALKNTPFK